MLNPVLWVFAADVYRIIGQVYYKKKNHEIQPKYEKNDFLLQEM
jgi:hypothetical protein